MSILFRTLLLRVERRKKALKRQKRSALVSDRAISLAAGLSADYLRSLRRQYDRGLQKGVTTSVVEGLAKALRTTPEWLLHGSGSEEARYSASERTGASKLIELRFARSVRQEGTRYFVDEQLDDNIRTWGPLPSESFAYVLIEDRKAQLLAEPPLAVYEP